MNNRDNIFGSEILEIVKRDAFCLSDDYLAIGENEILAGRKLEDLMLTISELSVELEGIPKDQKMNRVFEIYEMWYEHIRAQETEAGVPDFFCHKGCSSCCHQPVKASTLEVENILRYVKQNNIKLDKSLISKQLEVLQSYAEVGEWKSKLGESNSRCLFLDPKSGSCMVHSVRPLNCRNFFSVGSSEYCGRSTEGLSEEKLSGIKQVRFQKLAEISSAFLNIVGGKDENRWLIERVDSLLSTTP